MDDKLDGSSVFVSYRREDRSRVAVLVERLRASGMTVWWDDDIPGGAAWRSSITARLSAARCVVVVWTTASVSADADFVHEEANEAKARGILLPIRLDEVTPPLGFREIHTLDLIGWSGGPHDPRLAALVDSIGALTGGVRPARPAMRRLSRWTIGAALAASLGGLGVLADLVNLQDAICRVPGVRSLCGRLALGGVPAAAEVAMWAGRPSGDCDWLRRFIVRFPDGTYAGEAGRRLQAVRHVTEEEWQRDQRVTPLFVRSSETSHGTEADARRAALQRGERDAGLACSGYTTGFYRLRGATVDMATIQWHCERHTDGVRCSFEGHAQCQVDVRQTTTREVCQ